MLKRTITSVFIVLVAVVAFLLRFIDERLFNILLGGMAVIGSFEMVRAYGDGMTLNQKIVSVVFPLVIFPVATFCSWGWTLGIIGMFFLFHLAIAVIDYKKVTLESVALGIFTMVYPDIILLSLVYLNGLGSWHGILLAFVISPLADTLAYLVGSLLKGKKLCPNISPNKTISGAIGGLFGGVIGSLLVYWVVGTNFSDSLVIDLLIFSVIGLLCAFLTEFGDLVESRIKRLLGVKDLGKMFPGHGGIMDRIDGLLYSAVALFIIFGLIMPAVFPFAI